MTRPNEKRNPPAFQVYAADDLARESYFGLSLSERGLLDAMRRACWVSEDGTVPAAPAALAIVVRSSEDDVRRALTPRVLHWFQRTDDGGRLFDPELRRQLTAAISRREGMSHGAASTNEKRWKDRKRASPTESPAESPGESPLNGVERTGRPFQKGHGESGEEGIAPSPEKARRVLRIPVATVQ